MFHWFTRKQEKEIDWQNLSIEPLENDDDYSASPDTDDILRNVRGFVLSDQEAVAAYIVRWKQNKPELRVNFDLVIGKWGARGKPSNRQMVSLVYHFSNGKRRFDIINPDQSSFADSELASTTLTKEDVFGKEIARSVFAIVNTIFTKDARLAEIRGW